MRQRSYGRRGAAAVLSAALLVGSLAACSSSKSSSSGTTTAAGASTGSGSATSTALSGTVEVGFIGSQTGLQKQLGASQKNGASIAIDEINASGGILGKKLVGDFVDDQGDATQAVSQARTLIQSTKPPVIFGANTGPNSEAIEPIVNDAKIIDFPASSASTTINATKYPYSFRGYLTEVSGTQALLAYMKAHSFKTVTLLETNNVNGTAAESALKAAAPAAGITVAGAEVYNVGTADFSPIALKVKSLKADVVYIQGSAAGDFANFAKAVQTQGVTGALIGNAGITSATFAQLAAGAGDPWLGQVYKSLTYTSSGPNSPAAVDFIKKVYARGGQSDLLTVDLYFYDMVKLWASAVKKAGSTDPDKVKTALEATTGYQGLQGTFSFSATQHDGLTPDSLVTASVNSTSLNSDGLWKQVQ